MNILFRCHKLGSIMPSEKARVDFTKTQIDAMVEIYAESVEGRKDFVQSKYLEKGNDREEDSITLLSLVSKKFYKKNDQRLSNDFITGELDLFEGESVKNAIETIDIKTSWSRPTFLKAKAKELDSDYYWQGMGYMGLSKAQKHTVAFCLVNGTANHIMAEKFRLQRTMGIIDPMADNPEYKERCKQIEINHIFDLKNFIQENPAFDFDNDIETWNFDIPMEKRVHVFEVARDEKEIEKMYKRIEECRGWMTKNLL